MHTVDYVKRPFCACSTPAGKAGIAVIRVSGDNLSDYVDGLFRIIRSADASCKKYSDLKGYMAAYADFVDPENERIVDKVIITRFVAPHSYTGDEMLEISCHGGDAVKQEILRILTDCGISPAERGEFTKTAFINGKLDLSEAEAVMNVINSDSRRALMASNSQLCGALSKKISEVEDNLYKALALIEMIVEFPEHDDTPENSDRVCSMVVNSYESLLEIARSYEQGRILSERLKVALCGLPNSGKSTLLNSLAGFDRAIVTDTPGTTRDTLEIQLEVDGIPVTVVDTAGIRETDDKIEAMGVKRALSAADEADLVLYLVSPDMSSSEVEAAIGEFEGSKLRVILTKGDLDSSKERIDGINEGLKDKGIESSLLISAKENQNMDLLRNLITEYYSELGGTTSEGITILSSRHHDLLIKAVDYLIDAENVINLGVGVDVASSVIRSALDSTGEITGKVVSGELVNTIFSEFCIGK